MTHTFKHGLRVTDERSISCGLMVNQPWREIGIQVDVVGNSLYLQVVNHWPEDVSALIQALTEANEAITEANQYLNP